MRVEAVNSAGVSSATIQFAGSGAGASSYVDLRDDPAGIGKIAAARENPPLANFLTAVNGAGSLFRTAGAKAWEDPAANSAGEFAFHSTVDLVFAQESFNFMPERYEEVVRRLVELWMRDSSGDTLSARLEILPCKYGAAGKEGGALRLSLTAKSASAEQARVRWGLGIVKVQQALLSVSRAMRQKLGIDIEAE